MTSGFEYNIDINKGSYYLLMSSSEFEALQKVLDDSGLKGQSTLTLCDLVRPHGWFVGLRDRSDDYESHEKMICLTIPNLLKVTEEQLKLIKSMEIRIISDDDLVREVVVNLKRETYTDVHTKYTYITEAGEQVLEIFDKEGVSYDINNLKREYHKLFIYSDIEIPGLKLISKVEETCSVNCETSSLYISWPNDATTNFLPT